MEINKVHVKVDNNIQFHFNNNGKMHVNSQEELSVESPDPQSKSLYFFERSLKLSLVFLYFFCTSLCKKNIYFKARNLFSDFMKKSFLACFCSAKTS